MTNFSFYSNENFALDMVKMLRKLGHTVITSYDAGQANQSIPDYEVLNYATINNLAVITFNRDDFIELHNNNTQHSGIIICKTDRDYQGQIDFLHEYLQNQNSLINRLIRIKKQQKKGSNQQIFITQEYLR
jgi:predicted nuclease of predicted toxin-antitoxin system